VLQCVEVCSCNVCGREKARTNVCTRVWRVCMCVFVSCVCMRESVCVYLCAYACVCVIACGSVYVSVVSASV